MSAVWLRMGADIRSRWRAWFGLALFVGLFGGAIIAAAAGARRTDTAYPRFLESQNASDGFIGLGFIDPCCASFTLDEIRNIPQVQKAVQVQFYAAAPGLIVSDDPSLGRTFNAYKVLEGRLPDPRKPDEVIAPFEVARRNGWHVGTFPRMRSELLVGLKLRIVGIGAAPGSFPPYLGDIPTLLGTPALYEKTKPSVRPGENAFLAAMIKLKRGSADLAAYHSALDRLAQGKVVPFAADARDSARNVDRSFGLQASALWLVAAAAALAFALVFSQTLSRETFIESTEYPTLRSLGMTEQDLVRLGLLRAGAVAIVGGLIAVVIAVGLSPLFPTGFARIAEPHTGIAFDATAIGVGFVAVVAMVCLLSILPARRTARSLGSALGVAEVSTAKPSATVSALTRAGFPPSATAGVRLALEPGRGRTAVPVRTTIIGVTLGIAALATALSFSASLDHLLATPRLYGQTWDAHFASGSIRSTAVDDVIVPTLRADSRVVAIGTGTVGLTLKLEDDLRVGSLAMDDVVESVSPVLRSGRLPRNEREILLGEKSLGKIKKGLDDTVRVGIDGTDRQIRMRIVGTGIIPAIGSNVQFGEGAMVRYSGLGAMCNCEPVPPPDTAFVRYGPGVDAKDVTRELRRLLRTKKEAAGFESQRPEKPTDLVNFGRVQALPLILAGLLGGLAAAVLGHALLSVIRRRRRDLAILKTLGFQRRQVRGAVAWQASTLVTIALAIGLPVGVMLGRVLWTTFADGLGVIAVPRVPVAVVGLAVPAGLILANLIAARPARNAARTSPALVLRTE
jgi:ABC-type antimicrobial peptide transport system permease subunit